MADDGFGDGFGLRDGGSVGGFREEVEGEVAALELEAEEGRGHVVGRGADVVQEAGEEVGFAGEGPGWEMELLDCLACNGDMGSATGAGCFLAGFWAVDYLAAVVLVLVSMGVGGDLYTVVVYPHAVIECLLVQFLLCILHHLFGEWGVGKWDVIHSQPLGLDPRDAFEQDCRITGHGCPTVYPFLLAHVCERNDRDTL